MDEMFDGNACGTNPSNSSCAGSDGGTDEIDRPVPQPKYEPFASHYDMTGSKYLFIFNHYSYMNTGYFQNHPPSREGTSDDVRSLRETFSRRNFEVTTYNDLIHDKIVEKLSQISKMDHSSTSCIAIAILTHGSYDGYVFAADRPYQLGDVIKVLQNQSSLAGKPKLFFVQACRGDKTDAGHDIQLDGDVKVILPTHADCLILFSAFDEYISFRKSTGSWLIQTLCKIINEHHEELDLMTMLTLVNQEVASKIAQSDNKKYKNKKQIPETRFTLTKFLKL